MPALGVCFQYRHERNSCKRKSRFCADSSSVTLSRFNAEILARSIERKADRSLFSEEGSQLTYFADVHPGALFSSVYVLLVRSESYGVFPPEEYSRMKFHLEAPEEPDEWTGIKSGGFRVSHSRITWFEHNTTAFLSQ